MESFSHKVKNAFILYKYLLKVGILVNWFCQLLRKICILFSCSLKTRDVDDISRNLYEF